MTSVTRPASSRSAPSRPVPVWPVPLALAAGGAGALALAPMTGYPIWCQGAGAGGVALSVAAAVSGTRRSRRRDLMTALAQGLAPLIGHPGRTKLAARRWRGGFVGAPTRVTIRYSPESRAHDPGWTVQVTSIAAAQLGVPLHVKSHDPRRRMLELKVPPETVTAEMDVDRQRAERNILKLLGPTGRIVDIETTEGIVTRVRAAHEDATRFATSGHRSRIERTLSEVMPGRWRGVWQLEKDTVTFEVRPALPDSVWMPAEPVGDTAALLSEYSRLKIPIVVDEDGQVLHWQPKVIPQGLIVGSTGSGKTSTSHALVSEITRHGFPVWISDAKRIEFLAFRDWPNVQLVATTIEQQVALVWQVQQLMEHRLELVEHGRARLSEFEPLFVVLDEFAEMRDELLDWYPTVKPKNSRERQPPTLKHVARVARKARSVRIHLLVLLQRPDAAFLSGEMRDNFGFRMSMGRLSPQGAQMMWENASVGVTLPRDKTGRCMAVGASGRPVEAQAFRFPDMDADPDTEEGALLARLRPEQARHERYLFTPVEESMASDTDDPDRDPTFWDYAHVPLVRATDRPDLDPLVVDAAASGGDPLEDLGSASILLGTGASRRTSPYGVDVDVDKPGGVVDSDDPLAQYGEPLDVSVDDIEPGFLVLVDEELDHWAVVESAPVDDLDDDGRVALFWKDYDGEEGVLSLDPADEVATRRPRLDDPMGQPLPGGG